MAAIPSLKHIQVDKVNSTMLIIVGVAAFVTIFALLSSKTLYGQLKYQDRVATAKQTALTQLKSDVTASQQLQTSYAKFNGASKNLLGQSSTGTGLDQGDNAQIVLDALPSQYDYPALTTSIQALLQIAGLNIDSIGGTDQQASVSASGAISATATTAEATPVTPTTPVGSSVAMPFLFSADGSYADIQKLFTLFEGSIRPLQFQTIDITAGANDDLTLSATAQTYYQPQESFNITTETVK
jgi:hypothetical protein